MYRQQMTSRTSGSYATKTGALTFGGLAIGKELTQAEVLTTFPTEGRK